MGEQQDVPRCSQRACDHLVGACPDLARRLAPRDAVRPERPSGTVGPDVDSPQALVVPVVPLEKVVGGLTLVCEAGEAARLRRPRERAREHERELAAHQAATREPGLSPTLFREWDVGAAGVATELGPLGLTVANENDLVGGHDCAAW